MKKNMGLTDRVIRIVLAILFLLAIVMQWVSGIVAIIAGVLALVFIATSVVRVCPLYMPFGIKTFKDEA